MRLGDSISAIKTLLSEEKIPLRSDLGDLGEDYAKSILSPFKAEKIIETKEPTPDFKIKINGTYFFVENKTITSIYNSTLDFISNILKKINQITYFYEYDFFIDPFNIHENYQNELEKILIERWSEKKIDEEEFQITLSDLTIINLKIIKKNDSINGVSGVFCGEIKDPDKNLCNQLNGKTNQIKKADILTCVILNNFITSENIRTYLYPFTLMLLLEKDREGKNILIAQQKYIFWEKYPNLKSIIAIFPQEKQIAIYPSLKLFENFNCGEYSLLLKGLKSKGFQVKILSHHNEWRITS